MTPIIPKELRHRLNRLAVLFTVAAFFHGGIVQAADTNTPPKITDVSVTSWSPRRTFYVERAQIEDNTIQIWLVSATNLKDRQLLYTYGRDADVLVSADDHWLVINDHSGSDLEVVLIFREIKGVEYKQVEDINDRAWDFVAAKSGRKKLPNLDHTYVEAVRWTDDHTILLSLHGYDGLRNYVEDWLCFYDVRTKSFSTDMDKHNQEHTTLEAK